MHNRGSLGDFHAFKSTSGGSDNGVPPVEAADVALGLKEPFVNDDMLKSGIWLIYTWAD